MFALVLDPCYLQLSENLHSHVLKISSKTLRESEESMDHENQQSNTTASTSFY